MTPSMALQSGDFMTLTPSKTRNTKRKPLDIQRLPEIKSSHKEIEISQCPTKTTDIYSPAMSCFYEFGGGVFNVNTEIPEQPRALLPHQRETTVTQVKLAIINGCLRKERLQTIEEEKLSIPPEEDLPNTSCCTLFFFNLKNFFSKKNSQNNNSQNASASLAIYS